MTGVIAKITAIAKVVAESDSGFSKGKRIQWWRHHIEMLSVTLALCGGNPDSDNSSDINPLIRSCGVFFFVGLNKLFNMQSNCHGNVTAWCICDVSMMRCMLVMATQWTTYNVSVFTVTFKNNIFRQLYSFLAVISWVCANAMVIMGIMTSKINIVACIFIFYDTGCYHPR